jgi:hypothetical protein
MAEAFAAAGIDTAEEIEALGADAAYARLIAAGSRPHFMAYLALALGLQGRGFGDLAPEEKAALRARFDAVAGQSDSRREAAGIEAILDRLGVGQPTSSRPEKK